MILCECSKTAEISYHSLVIEWCIDCGSIRSNSESIAKAIAGFGSRNNADGLMIEATLEGIRFRPAFYHRTKDEGYVAELGDKLSNRDLD